MNKVKILIPKTYTDNRGFFSETWNKKNLLKEGLNCDFVQDNVSFSHKKNTIRGLHLQIPPFEQAKLIRCSKGRIIDFAVDIRKGSPDYCTYISEELSMENSKQLYIPPGFLHGFITLEDDTEVCYKCSNHYSKDHEITIKHDDPSFNINWLENYENCILSSKDRKGMTFLEFNNPFNFT